MKANYLFKFPACKIVLLYCAG